jgi:hypothetical protein
VLARNTVFTFEGIIGLCIAVLTSKLNGSNYSNGNNPTFAMGMKGMEYVFLRYMIIIVWLP